MTSRGTSGSADAVDRDALEDLARCAPDSCGFWPRRCWMRRTSARVRSRWSRWSFSGSVSQPSAEPAVDVGDVAHHVRADRVADLRGSSGAMST